MKRTWFFAFAAMIIITAGLLRIINLATSPGWYSDEGTLVDIAKNLLDGNIQYLVFNKSTLLAARLPLFPAVLAAVFSFTGASITVLRWVTAGLGVISVGLLMLVVHDMLGEKHAPLALAAGLCLAIYPKAVLYSRLGFSYNLLTPLIIGVFWALYRYLAEGKRVFALLASLLIGMGGISDLMVFTIVPALLIIVIYKNWRDLYTLLAAFLPFSIYALWMGVTQPEAFRFDFIFTFFRLGSIPLIAQYPYIAFNYAALVFKDYWWTMTVAGLFFIPNRRLKYLAAILFFATLFALGRTAALPGLGYYYLIPLFPFIALGSAAFLVFGIPNVFRSIQEGSEQYLGKLLNSKWLRNIKKTGVFIITSLLLFVITLSPFVITLALGFYQTGAGYATEIDPVLVNVSDGLSVIQYVNDKVKKGDLVIASPALAWAIETDAADFQMSLAYLGQKTLHFPSDIPPDRFSYSADYHDAAYVIVDPIWTNWAATNMEGVANMVSDVTAWPMVFSAGEINVYRNPDRQR